MVTVHVELTPRRSPLAELIPFLRERGYGKVTSCAVAAFATRTRGILLCSKDIQTFPADTITDDLLSPHLSRDDHVPPTSLSISGNACVRLLPSALAADWPQWGGGPTRNPVSLEKRLPLDFKFKEVEDGIVTQQERGITWRAELGGRTMIPPVVADGLVWVGTNTRDPMNDKTKESDRDGGLLLCFRESDGKLLWEHRTPRLSEQGVDWIEDFPGSRSGRARSSMAIGFGM